MLTHRADRLRSVWVISHVDVLESTLEQTNIYANLIDEIFSPFLVTHEIYIYIFVSVYCFFCVYSICCVLPLANMIIHTQHIYLHTHIILCIITKSRRVSNELDGARSVRLFTATISIYRGVTVH